MKIEITGERYLEALKSFLPLYYKEELTEGSLRKTIKVYLVCTLILVGFCFLMPGMKELYFLVIGFLVFMVLLISTFIGINLLINKKKKLDNNIERVEQIYENKVSIIAYLKNGSIDKTEYNYTYFKKVVENEDCFFLFLNYNLGLPLVKDNIDRDEFIKFMFSKNIVVRERKVK